MAIYECQKCKLIHSTAAKSAEADATAVCPKCKGPTQLRDTTALGCLKGCLQYFAFCLVFALLFVVVCIPHFNDMDRGRAALARGRADGGRWAADGKAFPDEDLLRDHADFRVRSRKAHSKPEDDTLGLSETYLEGFRQGYEKPRYRFFPAIDLPEDEKK